MKTIKFLMVQFFVFLAVMAFAGPAYAVNSPKTVIAQVKKSDASFPAASSISITVTDAHAETTILTDNKGIVTYNETNGLITIVMGNFTAQWASGDALTIDVTSGTSGQSGFEIGTAATTLDSTTIQSPQGDTNLAFQLAAPAMAVTSGDNQSAAAGTALTSPFVVTLTTGGTANAGVDVTFTAPTGATFASNSTKTETVTTNSSGVATSSILTLSNTAGAQNVSASATGFTTQVFNVTATAGGATAANSTISPTTPQTITADQTATFTVNLKDANNNGTTDLGGATLAVAGATSARGTWTIVNNNDTTATAIYTPTGLLGTDNALQVTLGGTQIGSNLSVTVIPGTASAANTQPVGTPPTTTDTATPVTFTVQLFDQFNNPLITGGDSVAFVGVALAGANFSAVTDNNNGTYSVTYTPQAVGTENSLFFTVNGSANQAIPALTVITPGVPVAANAVATWAASTITADQTGALTIQLKDLFGNNLSAGGATVAVTGNTLTNSALSTVADNGDGTYAVTYTSGAAGTENLAFTVGGAAGSTVPALTVTPGAAVAANTQPVGAPPTTTNADTPVSFNVQLADQFGNPLSAGGDTVSFGGAALTGATFSTVTDNGDGTYSVTYTSQATGVENALFFKVNSSANQVIPQSLTVTPGASVAANAAATWAASSMTADQTGALTIQLKDQFNNNLTTGGATVAVSGNALSGATLSSVTDNGNGTYAVTYTPGAAGTENLAFTVGGAAGSTVPALSVTHGAADHIVTTVNPSTINLNGTSTAVVTATIVDAKGNTVDGTSSVAANNGAATSTVTFSASATTLITLPTNVTPAATAGIATVTVTSKTGATSGSVTLSATAPGLATAASNTAATLNLTAFILDKTAINLIAGETFAFTLSNGTANSAWALTGPNGAAAGGTLSSATGTASTYTAGAAAGVDTLTVTDAGGKLTTATITVKTAVATDITAATGVKKGATQQITASGGDGNYTYVSSDPTVLTVDNTGKVTAVKAGTATVTVTDGTTYNGATAVNKVTTANIVVVDGIVVTSGATAYLDTGTHNTSTIIVTGGSAGNAFASGDTAVATVDANGTITAVGVGTATITVTEATHNTSTATVTVHVNKPLAINDTSGAALTTTQKVSPTGSLTVKPAGGSGAFAADVTGPDNFNAMLIKDANGNFTFTPPATGAFAGDYTLTLTDTASALATTLTISVPLKVTASRLNILELDATQKVTITGGAAGDVFSVVVLDVKKLDVNSKPTPDTGVNAIAADIPNVTAVADAPNGNPATATIKPVDVTAITPFTIQAADTTQAALKKVETLRMHVIPVNVLTLTVKDASGNAIQGATVKLRLAPTIISAANVTTTTDAAGVASPTLPVGTHVFVVKKTGFLPGVITLEQGATTGSVALSPNTNATPFTGNINGKNFTLPSTTRVVAVDASGNEIEGIVTVAAGGATATFTLDVDLGVFTPVKFVATAPGANSDDKDPPAAGSTEVARKSNPFELEAEETEIPEADLAKAVDTAMLETEFTAGTINAPAVPVALSGLSTAVAAIKIANKPAKGTMSTPGASATVTDDDVVFQVLEDAAGNVLSAPAVHKPLKDTNGNERRELAGTKQLKLGDTAVKSFVFAATTKLSTLKSVGVQLPADAFKTTAAKVAKVMTTVSGVKSTSARAALTGGELVEIDLAVFDTAGALLSTNSGNAVLNKVLVQVPINPDALAALGFDPSTANAAFASGKLAIYSAPTVTVFEAGNTTIVSGPVTYDPATGMASFFTNHFSTFGAGGAGGGGTPILGGGGGCALSAANGSPIDPVLPALALLAAAWLWRRRRTSVLKYDTFTRGGEMIARGKKVAGMKKICTNALIAIVSMVALQTEAEAIPAFARQTGAACLSCHFQSFPALNAFGRAFKTGSFTDVGDEALIEDDNLSIPAVLNASFVVRGNLTNTSVSGSPSVTTYTIPADANLLLAGRIGSNTGAFIEFNGGAANWQLLNSVDVAGFKFGLSAANTSFGGSAAMELSNVFGQHSGKLGGGNISAINAAGFAGNAGNAVGGGSSNTTAIAAWIGNDLGYIQLAMIAPADATTGKVNVGGSFGKLVRGVATLDVGGWDVLLGLGTVSGSAGKGDTSGGLTAVRVPMDLEFIDVQVQGEIGDMSVGVYFDGSRAKGKSSTTGTGNFYGSNFVPNQITGTAGTFALTPFSNVAGTKFSASGGRIEIMPMPRILLGAGYRWESFSGLQVGQITRKTFHLAATYQIYQNMNINVVFDHAKINDPSGTLGVGASVNPTTGLFTPGVPSFTTRTTVIDVEALM